MICTFDVQLSFIKWKTYIWKKYEVRETLETSEVGREQLK